MREAHPSLEETGEASAYKRHVESLPAYDRLGWAYIATYERDEYDCVAPSSDTPRVIGACLHAEELPMSLVDAYTSGPKGRDFARPTAEIWLDTLTDDDRDIAWKMIHDTAWTSSELFRVFSNNGLPGAANTFDGWRRRVTR